jgi:ribonuclease R
VHERGMTLVIPEDQRIKHDIVIDAGEVAGAQPGQVVVVEILDPPTRYTPPIGLVVEILGGVDDPGMEVEIAVRKFDVPSQFSTEALAIADALPEQIRRSDVKGRIDLRDLPFMTIDGDDARDFDDAVYAEPAETTRRSSTRLLVAIADVGHYVQSGDALDRDAYERATSVYFPRRVIPMLPEKLSNGLCSLNPNVERLVLVCDMVISAAGKVTAYQFYEAVIISAARLTYDQAWSAMADPEGVEANRLGPLHSALMNLVRVYESLAAARAKRGAIELETVETYMQVGTDGRIEKILPRVRNNAHRLIEECMLAANTSAADFLRRMKRHGLYRVHEGPTPERLKSLRDFLKLQGLSLSGGDDPQPADYAELSKKLLARPDARLLQTLLLRSMQQAIYSPDNAGHFGLAYEAYTHFTSPIRRYPDLLTHRVIKAALASKNYLPSFGGDDLLLSPEAAADASGQPSKFDADRLDWWRRVGDHCSAAERRADEASRDVGAWLKCQFMRSRVGEQFRGTVTGVTSFGLFITLDSLYVEGLVHVSELGAEYFQYNEVLHELRGERTGVRFRLYDPVSVLVSRVDLDGRRIEFRLVPSVVRSVRKQSQSTREALDWEAPTNDDLQALGPGPWPDDDEPWPELAGRTVEEGRGARLPKSLKAPGSNARGKSLAGGSKTLKTSRLRSGSTAAALSQVPAAPGKAGKGGKSGKTKPKSAKAPKGVKGAKGSTKSVQARSSRKR